MILVTGATGNVGSELVRLLVEQETPTRGLVRTPEKADALRGCDCEVAIGDFADPAALDDALDGVDAAYLVTAAGERQAEYERTFIDAAARAGGVRVVKQAVLGFGTPERGRIGDAHADAVRHLVDSGLPHTVLAPNFFMQNMLGSAAVIQEQGVLPFPAGDAPVSLIDARDVAAVAAHVLTHEGHEGATYELTGRESLTYAEVAARLSRAIGRDVHYVDVPPDEAQKALRAALGSAWLADGMVEVFGASRAGLVGAVTDEVEKAVGRPARTLEDFLADHRNAFA